MSAGECAPGVGVQGGRSGGTQMLTGHGLGVSLPPQWT